MSRLRHMYTQGAKASGMTKDQGRKCGGGMKANGGKIEKHGDQPVYHETHGMSIKKSVKSGGR